MCFGAACGQLEPSALTLGWMAQSAVVRRETRLTFGKGVIEADSSGPRAFPNSSPRRYQSPEAAPFESGRRSGVGADRRFDGTFIDRCRHVRALELAHDRFRDGQLQACSDGSSAGSGEPLRDVPGLAQRHFSNYAKGLRHADHVCGNLSDIHLIQRDHSLVLLVNAKAGCASVARFRPKTRLRMGQEDDGVLSFRHPFGSVGALFPLLRSVTGKTDARPYTGEGLRLSDGILSPRGGGVKEKRSQEPTH